MKLYWKVADKPTGRYRSFERRSWPTAYYGRDGKPAAFLSCEDDYRPADVREGKHAPITLTLLHHQHPEAGNSWKRFRYNKQAKTLDEAKQMVQEFVDKHPDWHPRVA